MKACIYSWVVNAIVGYPVLNTCSLFGPGVEVQFGNCIEFCHLLSLFEQP